MRRPLPLLFVALLLAVPLTASAQMIRTYDADQKSKTLEVAMEVYFCEAEGGFSFSLYDMRVNPFKRVLHKYEIKGLESETGKMKRAKEDRTACAGAPESSITSESVTVKPIPVPEEEDSLWILQLKLEGNTTLPIAVARKGLPFKVSIQYHPETERFEILQ